MINGKNNLNGLILIKNYNKSNKKKMYKFDSMGYMGGVAKVSRGPWFRDAFVEDDGLDWMYSAYDMEGKKIWLSSNNIPVADRMKMSHLYHE